MINLLFGFLVKLFLKIMEIIILIIILIIMNLEYFLIKMVFVGMMEKYANIQNLIYKNAQ